jgi:hypothetical protein
MATDTGNSPPYEGRTKARGDDPVSEDLAGTVERQLDETVTGRPGATASPARERPVSPGEVSAEEGGGTPESPHGVGESVSRRGEDVKEREGNEPGRHDLGPRGQSQRPSGTSDQRASTGVDPQDLADEGMPGTFTGDQGG